MPCLSPHHPPFVPQSPPFIENPRESPCFFLALGSDQTCPMMTKLSFILSLCLWTIQLSAQSIPAEWQAVYAQWKETPQLLHVQPALSAISTTSPLSKAWKNVFEAERLLLLNQTTAAIALIDKTLRELPALGESPQGLLATELQCIRINALQRQPEHSRDMALWIQWDNIALQFEQQEQWERAAAARADQTLQFYLIKNDFQQTDQYIQRQLTDLRQRFSPQKALYHHLLLQYSSLYFAAGKFQRMARLAEEGYTLLQQHRPNDLRLQAEYCEALGTAYNEQHDVDRGENYYNLAFQYFQKIGNPYKIAQAQYNVARVLFFQMRDWKTEIRPLMLEVVKTLDTLDWNPEQQVLNNVFVHLLLAEFYINDNVLDPKQLDVMMNFYKKYEKDIVQYDLDAQNLYRLKADIYLYKRDFKNCLEQLHEKVAFCIEHYGEAHQNTIAARFELGRVELWSRGFEEALRQAEAGIRATTQGKSASELAASGKYDAAFLEELYYLRAGALSNMGRWEEAYAQWIEGVRYVEESRRHFQQAGSQRLNTQRQRRLMAGAVWTGWNLYQQKGDSLHLRRMLEDAERTRSGALYDYLSKFRNNETQPLGIPDSLLRQQERLLHDIDSLLDLSKRAQQAQQTEVAQQQQRKVAAQQQQLRQLNDNMQRNYADAHLWQMGQSVSFDSIQAHLSPETAYISYFISNWETYVFYVTQTDFKVREIAMRADSVNKRVIELRSLLTHPQKAASPQEYEQVAHRFYLDFVADSLLENKQQWIILPDGALHLIPFDALVYKLTANQTGFNHLYYLLEKHSIRYEYSTTLLLQRQAALPAKRAGVLGLAPHYPKTPIPYKDLSPALQATRSRKEWLTRQQLIPLDGTEREIHAVQRFFNGDYWLKEQANEADFKKEAPKHAILHCAMHSLPDFQDPMYGALVFSENQDTAQDNFLYVYEIYGMDLRATQLVVLSACQTAEGEITMGEGTQSVGQAFLYAGAASLVSTQWELNDAASVQIMEYFYKNLEKGLRKDEALREAKKMYLKEHPSQAAHPFYWSSFVLVGDPSPLHTATQDSLPMGLLVTIAGALLILVGFWFLRQRVVTG